jgi:hypothetical protein
LRLTVVGDANEQVVISDVAIVTLRRPMDAERAMAMQFGALGGLTVASQDKKADKQAAGLRPRPMESIRGVVECKVAELPVEFTRAPGWPKAGAGMMATIYPKSEFKHLSVSLWRGIRFILHTSEKPKYIAVSMWNVSKVRKALSDSGYPLQA